MLCCGSVDYDCDGDDADADVGDAAAIDDGGRSQGIWSSMMTHHGIALVMMIKQIPRKF